MSGFAVHPHRASRRCSRAECRVDGIKTTKASARERERERNGKVEENEEGEGARIGLAG